MQAVILAAGKSTRCYPLTVTTPKPLLPVANRPLISFNLDCLVGLVKEAIILIGYRGNLIRETLGDSYKGIKLHYFTQQGLRGTGDAMMQVSQLIKERFLVISGDDLYNKADIHALARLRNGVLVSESPEPQFFGVIEHNGNRILRITEKPLKPMSNFVNAASYVFEPEILETLKQVRESPRGELEFTDAVNLFAATTKVGFFVARQWYPLSHSWKLLDANTGILAQLSKQIAGVVEPNATIKGKLVLGKGSVVMNGAYLEGDVVVGNNTQIGPNCYIRGSTTIGSNCKIGNAVEIKNSVLMDGVKVGHLSYVGDSVLGFNVNLGAGTIVANLRHDNTNVKTMVKGKLVDTGRRKLGAIIGDNVHTGINTSIYPGRKLWPNTTTRPGEIVAKDLME